MTRALYVLMFSLMAQVMACGGSSQVTRSQRSDYYASLEVAARALTLTYELARSKLSPEDFEGLYRPFKTASNALIAVQDRLDHNQAPNWSFLVDAFGVLIEAVKETPMALPLDLEQAYSNLTRREPRSEGMGL